jgi:hypothetical protein
VVQQVDKIEQVKDHPRLPGIPPGLLDVHGRIPEVPSKTVAPAKDEIPFK